MKSRFFLPMIIAAFTVVHAGNEVGFVERFALAADREKVLTELVPGTEDYYFFHALHYQNSRQAGKLAAILDQWRKRLPGSSKRKVIENRDALLAFDADPERTLQFLRDFFKLRFDHVQERPDAKPNLPSQLDPKLISHEAFIRRALVDDHLDKCTPEALAQLVEAGVSLRPAQRRQLLARIARPNVPGLVELIAADLGTIDSPGFGGHPIHNVLLPAQLDQLVKLRPSLTTEQTFVFARLRHLAPGAGEDVDFDPAAREAWLDRTWTYVQTLPPTFNSLKAALLFRRLDHDRKKGVHDEARFVEYLKLPRQVPYAAPAWIERLSNTGTPMADLQKNFDQAALRFPPIGNDEPLIREYFLQLFASKPAAGWERFSEWVRDTYLKPLFAEVLLVRGLGDREQLASLLSPAAFQRLNERVDLDFIPTNPAFLAPADDVTLELEIKNAPKLIVKLYELNALNYFLTHHRELNTDLPLDGLVANSETTHSYDDPPLRRVHRSFKFPELKGRRGAWIVEFIGGGRSSRALIRKGQWHLVQKTGAGSVLLTVLDENHQTVRDAAVWLDGRKLAPDEKTGTVVVPFTSEPRRKAVVLTDASGSFATLSEFYHHDEKYILDTQFHIEREQLLAGKEAILSVRAALRLHDATLPLSLLQKPRLVINSKTLDGIETTREIADPKLDPAGLFNFRFTVPERLETVTATLSGEIEAVSQRGAKVTVEDSAAWTVNSFERTPHTFDVHFSRTDTGYIVDLLGRNAEPIADRQVVFSFEHELFNHAITVALRSDDRGRIALGSLTQINQFTATLPGNRQRKWSLVPGIRTTDETIHLPAGQAFEVPLLRKPTPGRVALLEQRADGLASDHTGKVSFPPKDRLAHLSIAGLPPGDFLLLLPDEDRAVSIKVVDGSVTHGWAFSPARKLQLTPAKPLRIAGIEPDDKEIVIKLANANSFARVHVAVSRFIASEGNLFALGGFRRLGGAHEIPARLPNLFAAGRDIGDEYRYILERRYAAKFPGNMLARPGLLLNPWEKRSTDVSALHQSAMQQPAAAQGGREAKALMPTEDRAERSGPKSLPGPDAHTSLDFLANVAPVLMDLRPDENGIVRLDRAKLGDRRLLQVLATDLRDADWREVALAETAVTLRDLRLARNLDPGKPFTETKRITTLQKGGTLTIPDRETSGLETFETIQSVFALYLTLSGNGTLERFTWLLEWPRLNEQEKRAKYSEFACHELSFFLSRKDPEFFAAIIRPYLANKKDKTFMDEFLLGADLRRYAEPWHFHRLNSAERALLATRLTAEAKSVARHLRELWELQPPNPTEQDRLFETALHRRTMDPAVIAGLAIMPEAAPAAFAPQPPAPATPMPRAEGLAFTDRMSPPSDSAARGDFRVQARQKAAEAAAPGASHELAALIDGADAASQRARAQAAAYYRKIGATKEWAENNYYQLPVEMQGADLVAVNAFWRDFAEWIASGKNEPFLSAHFAEAHRNFTEMMLAMAVLDLPFDAPAPERKLDGAALTLRAGGPTIVVHKEMLPATHAAGATELLVSQNFYRHDDRYRHEGNEKLDKYVTDEFVAGIVYGANIVVTNPTSSPQKLELLLQIPRGSIPVLGSKSTDSRRVRLEPYTTQQVEYAFYFPAANDAGQPYPHYPVNVAKGEKIVGSAKPFAFNVVARTTRVDKTSWEYISQFGTHEEVLSWLSDHNIERFDLTKVAWRCRESVDFFRGMIRLLETRHHFDSTLYSYAVFHKEFAPLREWLRHRDELLLGSGDWLDTKLVRLDPIERRRFEQLEYSPLIIPRAHRLGSEHRIANNVVLTQYRRLLEGLSTRSALGAADQMRVITFLFQQDRVAEALDRLKGVAADALPSRLQYDYFRCYAAFYEADLAAARGIASQYSDHPIERWRNLFRDVLAQLSEIEGKPGEIKKDGTQPDRERDTAMLADNDPIFDFKVENRSIALSWRNLADLTVNYYLIDPEFSFSSNPFVNADAGNFSIIKPTKTSRLTLPDARNTLDIPLPNEFEEANVLVEIVGAGQRKAQVYHANTLTLAVAENYGRIELRDNATKPVPRAYVKVYARLANGTVRFFKDGYTDLRGKFDYASVNSSEVEPVGRPASPAETSRTARTSLGTQMLRPGELDQVVRLSFLVLSEKNGALVREVSPPAP